MKSCQESPYLSLHPILMKKLYGMVWLSDSTCMNPQIYTDNGFVKLYIRDNYNNYDPIMLHFLLIICQSHSTVNAK